MPREGQTAIGPNGERAVFRGGQWVMEAAGPAVAPPSGGAPGAFVPARAKPKEAPSGYRYNAAGNLEAIPGGPATTPDKPNLPAGYEIGPNGVARRIPGLPVEDATSPVDPAITAAIKGLGLDELLTAVASARREIGTGRATGVVGAIGRHIPGSSANDFAGSLDAIQGGIIMEKLQQLKDASKTGASGMGALSEREGARLAASVAALGPNMSSDKLLESLATIERHARALQAVADGRNPDDPAVAKQYGVTPRNPNTDRKVVGGVVGGSGDASGGGLTLSQGGTHVVTDPALTGANRQVEAMIRDGRSGAEIRDYLDTVRPGLGVQVRNLDEWIAYHNANPSKSIDARIDRVEKPLTPAGSLMNRAAQSVPGAMAVGAADMISGGTLDNMTSNPALARAGMAGVAEMHPNATLAGNVLGGIGAGMGAEGLTGAMGLGRMGATLAGDILPGMAYGAGSSDEGSRALGAGAGGLAGLVGGVTGRAAGRGISGVIDPAVKRLNDAGVRLTVPQMVGGAHKGLEDRLSGFPGFRTVIGGARKRGLADANAAAFAQAVVPPGAAVTGEQIGEAGVNNLSDAVSQAYRDALGGKVVQIDPQFSGDWGNLSQQLPGIPNVGPELQAGIAQTIGPMFQNGALTGESMQAIDRGLADLSRAYSDHPLYATHIRPAIDAANNAVAGMFERQAPDVMPAYRAAKQSYRNLSTISDAVNAGLQTDGMFTAAQLGTAARANAKKFGSSITAAKGERPFFQLQRDMQNVLPSKIPDPGTAGQMAVPWIASGALGGSMGAAANADEGAGGMAQGGGMGAIGGLGIAGALASPYVLRPVLQKALMAARPAWLQTAGEAVGRSRLPGALALPLLLPGGP
jgi:hypothetical protein